MEVICRKEIINLHGKSFEVLIPSYKYEHTYIGEFLINDYMIFSNVPDLSFMKALFNLIENKKESIIYLSIKKNGLPKYLENWFWDHKGNDFIIFHHSMPLNINDWRLIRSKINHKGEEITFEVEEHENSNLEDYNTFRYRENKDYLVIKRKFESIFFVGSAKVFKYMAGSIMDFVNNCESKGNSLRIHDHTHLDIFLKKEQSLCIDYFDEKTCDN
jgi:hypothetical protein